MGRSGPHSKKLCVVRGSERRTTRLSELAGLVLAERAGFEPAVRFETYTRFPGVRFKPLIHLSDRADYT